MSKADDIYHAFPKSVDGFATKFGQWSTKVGADGKTYQWLNKIEQIFMDKALNRSGIILYSKQDALNFIEECNKNRVGLLGLDGFFITDTTTQPSLDDSIDFSTDPHLQDVYDKAIEFIRSRKDNLYFEIVCE